MCNDEANYSSPEVFDPSRFLRHEKGDDIGGVNTIDPNSIVFGFGRRWVVTRSLDLVQSHHLLTALMTRVCVGLHHADAIMWLFMANVLAMFDILPPIDPIAGKEMQLSAGFDTSITRYINCSLRQYLCISWYAASLNVLATRYRSHAEFCRVHTDRVESFDHLTMITFVSSHHVLVPLLFVSNRMKICVSRTFDVVSLLVTWKCGIVY